MDFEERKEDQQDGNSPIETEDEYESLSLELPDSDTDDFIMKEFMCKNSTYTPTREEKLKLANMFIELTHKLPPQHQIEKSAGTRTLRKHEKIEFNKYITLKSGKFSKKEDKKIKHNWKTFCKKYDWDPENKKPFLHMKFQNKVFYLSLRNRLKFVQFLANGLFNRSLYSVYNRFKVKYDKHKKLRYKPEEDAVILSYMKKCKNSDKNRKCADIGAYLQRTRHSIWRRYQILKQKHIPPEIQ